ncbi:MAG: cell division protein ZapA [Endomicrobium sp.]|jgi:cell division protein ZapA|nr:cell division protein ZapA [Endomicrobium sp.]
MVTAREKIMGRDIDLNIDDIDESIFNKVVNFVNEKWLEVKTENVNVPDTQKIAALTAIKIAIELLKLRDLQKDILSSYENKIKKLIVHLDENNY